MTVEAYAEKKLKELEARVETEAGKTLANGHADAIHDLRVSIRRLTQALRALEPMIGKKRVKTARRRLRRWMDEAAEIRNRDIALELLVAAGISADDDLGKKLSSERQAAHDRLVGLLKEHKA